MFFLEGNNNAELLKVKTVVHIVTSMSSVSNMRTFKEATTVYV
jgi:hypothetical protein